MPGDWALPMLNSGFVYISKRDKKMRPVIVVNVAILKTFTAAQSELIAPLISYMMTYAVNKISMPGKAETFMIIIDLLNCSMTQMPITALRKFLGAVSTNFRGRGFKTCILNANMMIRGSWGLIKACLDEFT